MTYLNTARLRIYLLRQAVIEQGGSIIIVRFTRLVDEVSDSLSHGSDEKALN
ncbi:hypothetical protein [Nostoc sp.]|uniref:hypothetical protein n=1 Tax=Nostoc sp. TaxID=1180 RepID=UPI002FF80A4A